MSFNPTVPCNMLEHYFIIKSWISQWKKNFKEQFSTWQLLTLAVQRIYNWSDFRDPICPISFLHYQSRPPFFQYSCLLDQWDHFRIWKICQIILAAEDLFQDIDDLPNNPQNTGTLLEFHCRKVWKFLAWQYCLVGFRFLNCQQPTHWCFWLESTCTNTRRVLDRRSVHNPYSHSKFPECRDEDQVLCGHEYHQWRNLRDFRWQRKISASKFSSWSNFLLK